MSVTPHLGVPSADCMQADCLSLPFYHAFVVRIPSEQERTEQMNFSQMKVSTRLAVGFGLVACLLALVAFFALNRMARLEAAMVQNCRASLAYRRTPWFRPRCDPLQSGSGRAARSGRAGSGWAAPARDGKALNP